MPTDSPMRCSSEAPFLKELCAEGDDHYLPFLLNFRQATFRSRHTTATHVECRQPARMRNASSMPIVTWRWEIKDQPWKEIKCSPWGKERWLGCWRKGILPTKGSQSPSTGPFQGRARRRLTDNHALSLILRHETKNVPVCLSTVFGTFLEEIPYLSY